MSDEGSKTGRRAFIALGASAVLAGCTQTSSGGNSSTSTTMRDEEPTSSSVASTTNGTDGHETTSELVEINSNSSEPQATANISDSNPSSDGSTIITVWNDAETARTITVGVAERGSGESLFQNTYQFESDAYVEIEVSKVGKYTASVGVDGTDPRAIDFPTDSCNSKALDIAIRPDGTVESTSGSTEMLCPTVATTDSTN